MQENLQRQKMLEEQQQKEQKRILKKAEKIVEKKEEYTEKETVQDPQFLQQILEELEINKEEEKQLLLNKEKGKGGEKEMQKEDE